MWEHPYHAQYFFLERDLEVELEPAGKGPRSKVLGPSELFDVIVGEHVLPKAARRFPEAPVEAMREAITLTWSSFDTRLEEDEVVAESSRPVVRHETGLGPRGVPAHQVRALALTGARVHAAPDLASRPGEDAAHVVSLDVPSGLDADTGRHSVPTAGTRP